MLGRGASKFGAQRTAYNGRVYGSALEAKHAMELDLLKKAGEIKDWRTQYPVKLEVNGKPLGRHIVDFLVTMPDGSQEFHEVKGYRDPRSTAIQLWTLKRKLVEALYPGTPYRVYH